MRGDVVGESGVGMVFELSWWLVWKGGMEGRDGGRMGGGGGGGEEEEGGMDIVGGGVGGRDGE